MYVNMCPYGKMTKQHSCLCFVTHNDDNEIAATIVLMINEYFTTTLPDHSCFIPSQQLTFYECKVQRMCNKSKKRPMPKMPNPPLLVTSTLHQPAAYINYRYNMVYWVIGLTKKQYFLLFGF